MTAQEAANFIGIDFGTSKSTMAWYNPATGQAEILRNREGEEKTPSVVEFGEDLDDVRVGRSADLRLQDEDPEAGRRVVSSIKRDLGRLEIKPVLSTASLPGLQVRPVEVAAAILRKLKRDAEEEHFHRRDSVTRALITYPATFNTRQRDAIAKAGRLAEFAEIAILEEPVAAALAYSRAGQEVGRCVLVYDLGAATFDIALLARENGGFTVCMEPEGIDSGAGDDFDRALYDYCDHLALREKGRPISLTPGLIDPRFLRQCRERKELLADYPECSFSTWLFADDGTPDGQFKYTLRRAEFENLIRRDIETTVRRTRDHLDKALALAGC